MKLITRQAAIDAGELTYYTGEKCARGHDAPRYVTSCGCIECSEQDRLARRDRIRAARKARAQQILEGGA